MPAEQRWILARRPEGAPAKDDFELQSFTPPPLKEGEVAVRIEYHTVAPGVRPKLARKTHAAMVELGETIPGVGVGVVEASRHSAIQKGDRVTGDLGWASFCVASGEALHKLDPAMLGDDIPAYAAIDVLGNAGLTAYFGLLRVGEIKGGETVLVSSAAGSVGSVAGQIARLKGCDPVGVAGSVEKCAQLETQFGYVASVNYRAAPDLTAALGALRPEGYHTYFDNVGGPVTDAALMNMRDFGRLLICGQVSDYNRTEPQGFRATAPIISRRLRLQGFVLGDYRADFAAARKEMAGWVRAGKLTMSPTIMPGLALAVETFLSRFEPNAPDRPLIRVAA
ncbi:MAG: zinc-binding dehydrogenase [Hyphomonadaceae bacterium]